MEFHGKCAKGAKRKRSRIICRFPFAPLREPFLFPPQDDNDAKLNVSRLFVEKLPGIDVGIQIIPNSF